VQTFAEVFRFEIVYRLRQWSTWLYFAAMAFLTWQLLIDLMLGEAQGSGAIHANAPVTIAQSMIVATMTMLVATAGLFGDAAARDVESRLHPLIYTSPLSKGGYLAGRFLGAFTVNALLLGVAAIGLLFAELQRGDRPELFGAFRAAAYVQPYLVFALPTIFATGAIVFAISALTGRTIAGYAVAGFLFFFAMLSEEVIAEQLNSRLAGTIADPFAFTALSELAEYWTPFEVNSRLLPLEGGLLWNRIAWIAAGVTALAITQLRFRFESRERAAKRVRVEEGVSLSAPGGGRLYTEPEFGVAMRGRQWLDATWRSLTDVFLTRASLVIVVVLLALIVNAGWQSAGIILDTPTWPATYLVARDVLGDAGILLMLLSALFAGQLVWRERDARVSEIVDAAPIPNWVSLFGKLAAMVIALAAVQAALMAAGIFLQSMEGYREFEPLLYVKILFGIQLPHYVLWAVLALFVHVAVNQKYAGHFVFVMLWALSRFGRTRFGLDHNLLVWNADPGWSYSDLSGFEPFLGPWLSFKAYWAAWALLLMVIANLLWVRGRDERLRERLRTARERFTRRAAFAVAISALAVAVSGGWVFYNTNVLNEYRTGDDRDDLRAEYERRYKRYERLPQPLITHCRLHVEIEPARRTVDVRGTYRLENLTNTAIDTIHVLVDEDVDTRSLAFDRAARRVSDDRLHRYAIFRLERALQPREATELRFHVAFAPRGFTNTRASGEIVGNGTYFDRSWMPMIGYQRVLELSGDGARKERGLPSRDKLPSRDDLEARAVPSSIRDARWLQLETVVGTAPGQTAIAPGALRRTWTANGRRYFHYVTEAPIQNLYAIYSAAYAVREDRWNDVAIQVFHHPRHTRNLDRIVRATKASLDYHARHFGPYPHRVLRIVEFPRHRGTYARAIPTAIAFSEGFGFMARPENGIDYPFLVAAHEVSHQWWGNQVRPARVEGGQVLAETLAHYGAMMVMEQEHGRAALDRFRPLLLRKYLLGRRNHSTDEVPLVRSTDHSYLHYDKGAVAMYALREAIGEARVNAALRRLFEQHRFGAPPYPTTRELYAELQAVTPPEHRALLADLFEKITLWELRAKNARAERAADGTWRVTFTVVAAKVEADGIGRDRPVPMDELVEVGVFAGDDTLYLAKHRIRTGEQTITVTVNREPTRAGVDPHQKLIERELGTPGRTNNIAEIAAAGASL
jgi:ABC-2 type transport system permease protein